MHKYSRGMTLVLLVNKYTTLDVHSGLGSGGFPSNWDVTEKVWLRAMYSDGIAAQTRKTEGDLKTEG